MAWWAALAKGAGKSGGGKSGGGLGGIIQKGVDVSKRSTQAGVSGITSLVQQIQANKLKKKADAAFPELVDPNQAGYLAELNQKRRSIETGADFAAGMQSVNAAQAGTNEAITRAAGGDVSGTMQALLQAQAGASAAKNQVLAQGQNQQMQYNTLYGDLLDQIAGRKMHLQLTRNRDARAEWAAKQSRANQNFMGFLGGMPGMGKKGDLSQSAGTPSVTTTAPTDNGWQNIASVIPKNTSVNSQYQTPESAGVQQKNVQIADESKNTPFVDSGINIIKK
jgi:hypothetical protein